MAIFQKSVQKKYLKGLDEKQVNEAWERFKSHFHNSAIQENIRRSKEEQHQGEFLIDLFVKVLGYINYPLENYNLIREQKNVKDAKSADGAIIKDGKIIAVIELKGTDTINLNNIETQAFGYKNNQPDAVYVITSNFEKLRFYIDNAVDFEDFNLFQLSKDEFQFLWLCLSKESVFQGIPKQIKDESIAVEETVTNKLYKDYSAFRNDIFTDIVKNNLQYDKLTLFNKTQKLLDRFLFVFFAEDRLLLPPNSIREIVNQWTDLRDQFDEYQPLYSRFIKYFGYLNTGYKGKKHDIFAYNGGLFLPDELLDDIKIDDTLLYKHTLNLSNYDFESEVSVNILGHIFEHSLSEIEEIQAELEGQVVDKSKTKRKTDGVYYTPKFVTKYIVDCAVGSLCKQKKAELGIIEEEYELERTGKQNKAKVKVLQGKLERYRNWLLEVTICDPACGSGAFLNQALEFLITEHRYIDELQAQLFGDRFVFQNIENSILENNLFGVDINDESIEIAKLSLWLRTAQKGRKLTSLNNNIKCGNSLIADKTVAGDKAFDWEKEFPEVFAKGGFDVVIGNPPYGILIDKDSQKFYNEHFPLTNYKINLYVLFIERMVQILKRGVVHFIIPKSLLFNSYYEGIRKHLIENTEINEIFTITEKVFKGAEVGSSLLIQFTIISNPNRENIVRLVAAETMRDFISSLNLTQSKVPQNSFLTVPNCEISIVSSESKSVLHKINRFKAISEYYDIKNGLNPGNIKHILISSKRETAKHKPIIWGKDISRYNIQWGGDYVNYDGNIADTLTLDDIKSKEGMNKQNRIDFALRNPEIFERKKLVVRKTGDKLIACVDEENYYFDTLVNGIYPKSNEFSVEYLLAILNSKPATSFYRLLHDIKGKVFAKITVDNLYSFPIPEGSTSQRKDLEDLVKFILTKNSKFHKESFKFKKLIASDLGLDKSSNNLNNWYELDWKTLEGELRKQKINLSLVKKSEWIEFFEGEKKKVQELKMDVDRTDNQIDQLVYQLYELTPEEIKIVEGKS